MLSHAIRNGYGAGKARGAPGAGPGLVPEDLPGPRARRLAVDRGQEREPGVHGQDHVRPELRHLLHERVRTGHRAAPWPVQPPRTPSTLIQKYAADTAWGGYREMFLRDWQPRPSGAVRRGPQELRRAHAPHGSLHDPVRAHPRRDPQEEAPRGDRRAVEPHVPLAVMDRHRAVHAGLHAPSRHHVQDGVGLGPGQRRRAAAAEQHQLWPQHRVPVAVPARAVGPGDQPGPLEGKALRARRSTLFGTASTRSSAGSTSKGRTTGRRGTAEGVLAAGRVARRACWTATCCSRTACTGTHSRRCSTSSGRT